MEIPFSPQQTATIRGFFSVNVPLIKLCRGRDLNSRPRAYESPALPLSYLGVTRAPQILLWEEGFVNTRYNYYLGEHMKVLVLESDEKIRSVIQSVLKNGGHEMITAANPDEAIKSLVSGQTRFIIVEGDAQDLDKAGFIRQIRDTDKAHIYSLQLTSMENERVDFDDSLLKPFTANELKARIILGQRFIALGDNLSRAREQIDNLALYDDLTGLMNRNAFYRIAEGELERARRASSPLCVIALDIDNFKVLNDSYGIDTGDRVLKFIAQIVREKSRPYDCIGRWSGDEFILALPSVIGGDAEKIAQRIIKGVRSAQITSKNINLNIGLSAGIASAQRISAATEVDPLIEQARRAVRRAKENGGNQVNLSYV